MKKTAIWAVAMAISAVATAQQNPTAVKYSKLVSAEYTKEQLTIVASDEMEGRETGQPGAEKAAKYLADQYKKLGLLPANKGSYFLDVPLTQSMFKVNNFAINGTKLTFGKDFYGSGSAAAATVSADDIIFIGYGSEAELTADIKGKIVLLLNEAPPAKDGATAAPAAGGRRMMGNPNTRAVMAKGPALILAASPAVAQMAPRFASQKPRIALKKEGAPAAPTAATIAFSITTDVADQILKSTGKTYAQIKTAIDGGTPQSQTIKASVSAAYGSETKDIMAQDIVAVIPGNDKKLKEEVVVFSAHYDHEGLNTAPGAKDKVFNGADDDGSGTVGILAIARAFAQAQKDGKGPRRTVLFLGNVGEEKGLLGSEYYGEHPIYPMANTVADLNIDMIGRVGDDYKNNADSANYVFPIGSAMLSTELKAISDKANDTYTKLKLDYRYDDLNDPNRFYYRSDHYNFAKHGVPIIFWFNGTHPDYHGLGDEVSKINFPLLAKRAQHAFFVGWELANRDKRPVVDAKDAPKN
ncbi:M28 family peptidase [Mucilaginibacter myungsuensis]|uniref:M28 family peptidase n=1 Tax=Mucilaginibacter myungsuensis TaxID=649104 RepID=A0A929KTW1_9SPHI|nr:M28 family peptidase [Mucilaginibacter myungsuensis]MBE9661481.1 M28 family peptidase [Mucilaginibacter myungsuensis]MDN3597624.1 M28 family peptidase [Mucilaginibacter myungsuensis]